MPTQIWIVEQLTGAHDTFSTDALSAHETEAQAVAERDRLMAERTEEDIASCLLRYTCYPVPFYPAASPE